MARRTITQSEVEIRRERWNRWRILIRRADFQKDMRVIQQSIQNNSEKRDSEKEFCKKWGINSLWLQRLRDRTIPALSMRTVQEYETFYSKEAHLSPIPDAVEAYDPYSNDDPPYPEQASWPNQYMIFRADLSYPLTDMLNIIEDVLKYSIARRSKAAPGSYLPGYRTRRRTNLLTKQLEIFDRYMNGDSTRHIAQALHRPLSSVRTQLKTVFELTRYERQHGSEKLWEQSHVKKCPRCKPQRKLDNDCPEVARRIQARYQVIDHETREWEVSHLPPRK